MTHSDGDRPPAADHLRELVQQRSADLPRRAREAVKEPQILIPFQRSEALSIAEAAAVAGRSVRTLREWCLRHDLGRRIGGQWVVSKVALAVHLDGDKATLKAYLSGDRASPTIISYFERCDVPLRKRLNDIREGQLSELNRASRS
jgi:hypothetical protein